MADIAAQPAIAVVKASRRGLSEAWFAWALIFPAVTFIAVIVAWPLVETVRLSFTDADMGSENWVGLANYEKLLSSKKFYSIVGLTFFWMVLSVGLKLVVGAPVLCPIATVSVQSATRVVASWPSGAHPVGGSCVVPFTVTDAQGRSGPGQLTIDVLGYPQTPSSVTTSNYSGSGVTLFVDLGSVFDLERDSKYNSNSWANVRNSIAKAVSKQRDWGYTLGGPMGKAGGDNKLFSSTATNIAPERPAAASHAFACRRCSSVRATFRKLATTTARCSTSSAMRRAGSRAPPPIRAAAFRMAASSDGFPGTGCSSRVSTF